MMRGRPRDLTGRRFGRLVARRLAELRPRPSGCREAVWLCDCDCGGTALALQSNLWRGHTRSCGCLQRETMAATGRASRRADDGRDAAIRARRAEGRTLAAIGAEFGLTKQGVARVLAKPEQDAR